MTDKPCVLIVDDDEDIRFAVKAVLKDSGYAVEEAADAAEGLRKAAAQKPDLILLDIMMPAGTEGFHFIWDLRAHDDPSVAEIPIVILTALQQTTELRFNGQAPSPGADPDDYLPIQGFLEKPIEPDTLLSVIKKVVTSHG